MAMNVKQLREALEGLADDQLVVIQKDAEGNGYSPLSGVWDDAAYVPESTWSGDVYLSELTDELKKQGYEEEDVRTPGDGDTVKAVVLQPVN